MSAKPPMEDFKEVVRKALKHLNIEKAQPHSRINHHTEGLNYLNLQRSDKFTLKLYLLEGLNNNNSDFLVHPHNHRYDFNTVVLAGRIANVVFNDIGSEKPARTEEQKYWQDIADGGDYLANRFTYLPEKGAFGAPVETWLEIDTGKSAGYMPGESYFLKSKQIHTLKTFDEPTLLCLSQFEDKEDTTNLYLPKNVEDIIFGTARIPTLVEVEAMRLRALEMLS